MISASGQSIYLSGRYSNRFSVIFLPFLFITRCKADFSGSSGQTIALGSLKWVDVINGPMATGKVTSSSIAPDRLINRQFSVVFKGSELSFTATTLIAFSIGGVSAWIVFSSTATAMN